MCKSKRHKQEEIPNLKESGRALAGFDKAIEVSGLLQQSSCDTGMISVLGGLVQCIRAG